MSSLLFISALGLSAVAAYYSIMGLVAIFAAAATPIFIMGSLLEASKLVVASWLYKSWKEIPILMKSYFTMAVVVLMMLTSMGIFGYLSKAHLDQAVPSGDIAAKLALIDEKIKTEKDNIDAGRRQLKQLDNQVDQTIGRSEDSKGVERSLQIRRGQQKERSVLLTEIGSAQTRIARLNEERAPIASEVRKVEAEVGPIKYIAALIYDSAETDVLEKAVRIVIMMIVLVFDPLAVLMLVAANWQLNKDRLHEKYEEPYVPEVEIPEPIEPAPLPKESKQIIKDFFTKKPPELHEVVKDNISVNDDILLNIEQRTIEKEVESLQPKKKIDYDSLGRRITP